MRIWGHAALSALRTRLGNAHGRSDLAVGLAFVLLIILVGVHLDRQRRRELDIAGRELELAAGELRRSLEATLAVAPKSSLDDALRVAIQALPELAKAFVAIVDQNGEVIASAPDNLPKATKLADLLGDAAPLAILADRAGAIRLNDRQSSLAVVRNFAALPGQIALFETASTALADWRARARVVVALMATSGLILMALFVYRASQTSQARNRAYKDSVRRGHMELALALGRCGIWDWDLDQGVVVWSRSMFDLLGMDFRPSLTVDEVESLVHPDDRPLGGLVEAALARGEGEVDIEFRLIGDAGQWVWLRQRAAIVEDGPYGCRRLVGVALDITERKREAEVSATADQRLREAVEAISEAFVLWDSANRLVLCNSKYRGLHDLSAEAAKPGATYAEIVAQSTACVITAETKTERASEDPDGLVARTYEASLADGRWLQVNERRTRDGGFVSVGTDITELKEHEEQLVKSERLLIATVTQLRQSRRSLEAQADELQELAQRYREQKGEAESANLAKAEFLANMSHELRTPLNAVIGFSQMMANETFGPLGSNKYAEYASHILASGQYLLSVVGDVLDMASLESGRLQLNYQRFAAMEALREAAKEVEEVAHARRLRLKIEGEADAVLEADPVAVKRVLTTLLRNAVKFAQPEGLVTVGAQSFKEQIYFYVEDDGPGIAEDDIARIARPFVQARSVMANGMKGSGLGLSIAHSLVELHGGHLRLTSKLGEGTSVVATIPKRPPNRRTPPLAAE